MTKLREEFGGKVPGTMEELLTLPGVGRKTANVILGNIFRKPSVVVDTHVKRISRKLGFTENTDPEKVEYDLMEVLPKDHWILWNLEIIAHGRAVCTARKPDCAGCFLAPFCPSREDTGERERRTANEQVQAESRHSLQGGHVRRECPRRQHPQQHEFQHP
jgi:endonuclease-3